MVCYVCDKPADACESGRLLTCAGCKQERYCGKACQKRAWKNGHKEICSVLAANLDRQKLHSSPALFQKYSKEWLRRVASSTEVLTVAALTLPSPASASEMSVTFKCDWNPAAPDGSQFTIHRHVMDVRFAGEPGTFRAGLMSSQTFRWAVENLGKVSDENRVGVMCNFMFLNANDMHDPSHGVPPGSIQHVALPVPRIVWGSPPLIEMRREVGAQESVRTMVQMINESYGKQLHTKI